MTTARRRGDLAVASAIVLLALGAVVGLEAALPTTAPGAERAHRDPAMAWVARGLLAVAVAWVVIGMLAARTRLVGLPGAAAARATWIASTRPWRARESTLGLLELDRLLLVVVPGVLLVATRAVQASFLSWMYLATALGAWAAFALVLRLLVWRRSPWPVLSAVGGVLVLRCIVELLAVSFAGPGALRTALGTSPAPRIAYIAVAFALFAWVFIAAGWALSRQVRARRATGTVLAAIGAGLLVPSVIVGAIGPEQVLAPWAAELGPVPWYAAAAGAALLVAGIALAAPWRRAAASVTS